MKTYFQELILGAIGISSTGGSLAISYVPYLTDVFKLISLVIGIIVGIMTIVSIGLTIGWKIRNEKRSEQCRNFSPSVMPKKKKEN